MKKMTNGYNIQDSQLYKRNLIISERLKKGAIVSLLVAITYVVAISTIS